MYLISAPYEKSSWKYCFLIIFCIIEHVLNHIPDIELKFLLQPCLWILWECMIWPITLYLL